MKVWINREECIGCAACEALCPEVFKLSEDGKSMIAKEHRSGELDKGEVGEDLVSCVETARASCPVEVIHTK